jgi:hypothetical protein
MAAGSLARPEMKPVPPEGWTVLGRAWPSFPKLNLCRRRMSEAVVPLTPYFLAAAKADPGKATIFLCTGSGVRPR